MMHYIDKLKDNKHVTVSVRKGHLITCISITKKNSKQKGIKGYYLNIIQSIR